MPSITRHSKTIIDSPSVYERRMWDSQKPPFVTPMFLDYFKATCENGNRVGDARIASNPIDYFGEDISYCHTVAWERLNSDIGEKAGWLINLHQRREAMDMIGKRGKQLLDLAKALKSRDFRAAAKAVGFHPQRAKTALQRARAKKYKRPVQEKRPVSPYTIPKNFGDAWLEWHFGWDPIIKDLYASAEILQIPLFQKKCKGKSPVVEHTVILADYGSVKDNVVVRTSSRQTATIELADPDLWTLNSLGLLNPAIVVWDAVPWSFVFDWFSTLNAYLNSFNAFLGLKITNASNSIKIESTTTTYAGRDGTGWGTGVPLIRDVAVTTKSVAVRRGSGLIGPSVHFRQLKLPSITRAATAISLLLQFLH